MMPGSPSSNNSRTLVPRDLLAVLRIHTIRPLFNRHSGWKGENAVRLRRIEVVVFCCSSSDNYEWRCQVIEHVIVDRRLYRFTRVEIERILSGSDVHVGKLQHYRYRLPLGNQFFRHDMTSRSHQLAGHSRAKRYHDREPAHRRIDSAGKSKANGLSHLE